MRQALIARFWDAEAGAMVLNDADPRRDHTGDANAGNLMFETLDGERARSAMRFLGSTLATPHGTRASEFADDPYRASNMQGYIKNASLTAVRTAGVGLIDQSQAFSIVEKAP